MKNLGQAVSSLCFGGCLERDLVTMTDDILLLSSERAKTMILLRANLGTYYLNKFSIHGEHI